VRLTTKGEYGVRAVVNLASKRSEGPVPISQIAEEEDVSPAFLEQIFYRLKKAGLVRSVRGPKGGFFLGHDPEDISLKTILDAVGEPIYPVPCTNHAAGSCERRGLCSMSPVWHDFYDVLRDHLEGISLEDVLDGAGVKPREKARAAASS
jgi:Rrf2 family transcriptional regulator, iron-sulfur cluster assembly transcription factor